MHSDKLAQSTFNALLDAAADAIIVIGEHGHIRTINRAAEKLFSYDSGELQGQKINSLMSEYDSRHHDQYLQNYLGTGERKIIGIGRRTIGRKKHGECFPIYLSVGHVAQDGEHSFVGVIRDLSDEVAREDALRQGEYEIRQLREKLTHVVRVSTMGEMATGIAHEINQPLTVIATYAQACQRLLAAGTPDPEDLSTALGKISDEAQRASKVISGIRQLSKKQPMVSEDYNCLSLVNEVVALAKIYAQEMAVILSVDTGTVLANSIFHVDIIHTQQVLLNLINNAIESMAELAAENAQRGAVNIPGPSGEVKVQVREIGDGMLEIAVIDRGSGVDEGREEDIFDAFYTTKTIGLGMGLSICRSIVNAQGGEIYYESNPGGGSRFAFTAPLSLGG